MKIYPNLVKNKLLRNNGLVRFGRFMHSGVLLLRAEPKTLSEVQSVLNPRNRTSKEKP